MTDKIVAFPITDEQMDRSLIEVMKISQDCLVEMKSRQHSPWDNEFKQLCTLVVESLIGHIIVKCFELEDDDGI